MLKTKCFEQTRGLCGATSLRMVLNYYGIKKSESELARLSGSTRAKGVEAAGILNAAKRLECHGFIKDFSDFKDIRMWLTKGIPVILDWFDSTDGHYAVVTSIDRREITLADPAIGRRRRFDLRTFKRIWFDFPGDFIRSKDDLIIRRMIVILPPGSGGKGAHR